MFIERAKELALKCREACEGARKVLDEAEVEKHEEEGEFEEGERMAAKVQEEVSPATPFSQPHCAAELAQLRACVEELKAERNELRSRLDNLSSEHDAPERRKQPRNGPVRSSSEMMEIMFDSASSSLRGEPNRFHPFAES